MLYTLKRLLEMTWHIPMSSEIQKYGGGTPTWESPRESSKRHPLYVGQFTAMGKSIGQSSKQMKTFQTFRCPVQVLEGTVVYQLPKSEIYWNRSPPAVTTTSSFRFADDLAHFPEGKSTTWGVRAGSKRVKWHRFNMVQPPGEGQFSTAEALSKTGKSTNQLTHTHTHTHPYIYICVCRCVYIYK